MSTMRFIDCFLVPLTISWGRATLFDFLVDGVCTPMLKSTSLSQARVPICAVSMTQRPKWRNSQRDSDQNCARIEDVLAITVRRELLFWRKVGRDSTENMAIF
jgi:hypothetical protein